MPKATTEGGATNAWEPDWTCAECGAQVAPGAPRCPECPSVKFTEPEAMPAGSGEPEPAESDAAEPEGENEAGEAGALAEPQVPDAVPEPAPELPVPPRTPPRRT